MRYSCRTNPHKIYLYHRRRRRAWSQPIVAALLISAMIVANLLVVSSRPLWAQSRPADRGNLNASATPNVLQLNESFDAAVAIPNGWRVVNNTGTAGWVVEAIGTGGRENQNANDTGGTQNFAVADSDESGGAMDTELRSPTVNLANAQSVRLKFKTRFENYSPDGDTRIEKADVDVSVDGGTTWQNVWRKTTDYIGQETVDISARAKGQANVMVRFRYYDANFDYFWKIDDVQIDATTGGPAAPGGLTATADGQTSVKLAWTDNSTNETGFKIERSLDGTTGWAEIRKVGADVSQHTDTGLTCGTTYHYRVSAENPAGAAASNVANAKTVNCPTATVTAINESFTGTTLPNGWTLVQNKGNEPWRFNNPYNRPNETGGAGGFALADSDRNSNGLDMDAELRTPVINFTGKNAVTLEFRSRMRGAVGRTRTASVSISKDGGTTWTQLWQSTEVHTATPVKLDVSQHAANQANVMVRFRYVANDDYYWQIDDVKVEPLPLPAAPTALNVTLGGNNEPILAWTGNGARTFEVWRSTSANNNGAKIADVPNGATTYTDNSAASNSTYHYRVRATNAAGSSAYTNVQQAQVGDRSIRYFDLKVSHDGNPNAATRQKIEENFRHFADAIYEMSNGVHRLRRVEIFLNKGARDVADIHWLPDCHPKAAASGYGKKNQFITMCDRSSATPTNPVVQDYLANPKLGGWGSLGHEWGHYTYGLLDEYQLNSRTCDFTNAPFKPCKDDVAPVPSIMNSGDRAAFNNDISWLNFSYRGNNSGKTAHHRLFAASGWETLARPPQQDPRDGQRNNRSPRIHFPELARVAPTGTAAPSRELDKANQARATLNIVWMGAATVTAASAPAIQQNTSGAVRMLVIDRSTATTSQAQLATVKEALHQFIDRLRFGDTVGLLAYDSSVTTVVPITTIDGPATRADLHTAIDGIALGDDQSATGDALQTALETMQTLGDLDQLARAIYLIGRGQATTGEYPTLCIPIYQEEFMPLYAFDTGLRNDTAEGSATLREFSQLTKGHYRHVGSSRSDLLGALVEADSRVSPTIDLQIKQGYANPNPGQQVDLPIILDNSVAYWEVEVDWFGAPNWAMAQLVAPDGAVTELGSCELIGDATVEKEQETVCFATVEEPQAGTWHLRVQATEQTEEYLDLYYWAGASAKSDVDGFQASVQAVGGEQISYPEPVVINGYVTHQGGFMTGLVVTGTVEKPDGSYVNIPLRDDGAGPDATAGDGMYAGIFAPAFDGVYYIAIAAHNLGGTGMVSFSGLEDTAELSPIAIGTAFERFADMEVTVSGAPAQVADNLGGAGPAVQLAVDNTPVAGHINGAEDFTVYAVQIPADYTDDLILRVDNLALGMDPYVLVYNDSESWEREAYLETAATSGDFLALEIFASPGEVIYIEVAHYDRQATQGTYDISIGPRLASDSDVLATGGVETKFPVTLYFPLVHR